ncbi:heat-inducible transcriptional repressor HrcA [Mycoplasmatota bacterium WC44]
MLTERQNLVLRAIVEEFIKNAEPVGSRTLSKHSEVNFSPATIRNEMADLEELGYIEKTHTSSGRVPSEQGYRYYIDNILRLNEPKKEKYPRLEELFDNDMLATDEIIDQTLKLVSELTNYTSMVLGPSKSKSLVKKIELVKITSNEALIIIITDSGHVENRKLIIDELNIIEMQKVVKVLNEVLIDVPVNRIAEKLAFEIKRSELRDFMEYHESLIDSFIRAFSQFNQEKFKMSGQYNLLYEPEFHDINKVRSFIEAVEKREILSLMERNNQGLTIKIGSENRLQFMENCTLISIPYQNRYGEVGSIAVVGPKRMNYRKVIPLLEYIANNMNKIDK